MKHNFSFLMACSLAAVLSACGGGSDSQETPPAASSSAPAVSSSSVRSSSSAISSSVVSSSLSSSKSSSLLSSSQSSVSSSAQSLSSNSSVASSQSSAAAPKLSTRISGNIYLKDAEGASVDLDASAVKVTLSLLDTDEKAIAENKLKLIDAPLSGDDQGIPFAGELSGADATTIVVNISSPGYSDFARRFEFSKDINVTAILNELQEITLQTTEVTSISGNVSDGYNVSVINSDGTQNIVSGSAAEIADLSVSIPQSVLPSGTTSLDVQMQAFNPNDPEEAQSFPGAYEDSTGNKLLSVAFNYTDVKTNDGVSLQKIAQKTRSERLNLQKQTGKTISPLQYAKQVSQKTGKAAEPVIINRKIPAESCPSLSQLGDANITLAGFQVPVYTYDSTNGLWDLLGYGTLFNEAGVLVAPGQTTFDCLQNTYVLEIEATNEIFLSNWWNLDYPLIFQQPVKLCANVEFRDQANKPLAGSPVYLSDDDDVRSFSTGSFVTDESGRMHIEVISLDGGADLTATLHIYNPSLYSAFITADVTLSTSCNLSAPPVVIPVAVPETCKASGRVINTAGSPLAQHYIIAADFSGTSSALPGFALTDADGRYELSLQCKQKYQVIDWYSFYFGGFNTSTDFETNVNNSVDLSEVSDNGSTAVLKDLVFASSKPVANVYPTEDSLTQVSLAVLYMGTDFPLTYNFSIKNKNGVVLGQCSGTLTKADFNSDEEFLIGYAEVKIDHHLTAEQIEDPTGYSAVGEIKDAKGLTSPINNIYQE